ncbi:dienelactone hydrolase family protein [Candidatus Gracilibacteria bacterium]|nr:dienelactone hydrolase family protein [Candidatus Gracilibacteria bacterium]
MNSLSRIPENPTKNSKCIIMLHGVGSNKEDLFGLSSYFAEEDYIFSLDGCFGLGENRHAWYRVDFSTGKPLYTKEDLEKGYRHIMEFIQEISEKFDFSLDQIFLMGFSQGAIMSYYTLYRSPEFIGGIIALSGRILSEIDFVGIDIERYFNKKIFIGHGNQDQVIGVESSNGAIQFAKQLQIEPEVHLYNIPHTISQVEMTDIISWL